MCHFRRDIRRIVQFRGMTEIDSQPVTSCFYLFIISLLLIYSFHLLIQHMSTLHVLDLSSHLVLRFSFYLRTERKDGLP